MKLIKLTQGYYTKVDDSDYEWLNQYKWYVMINSDDLLYARNNGRFIFGKNISIHRLILNTKDSNIYTDHIDRDGLNNQRYNLRTCTASQNMWNRRKPKNGLASKYLGVTIKDGKYQAQINSEGKYHYLGLFKSERHAAIEYDKAAIILHGEFARLNILSQHKLKKL